MAVLLILVTAILLLINLCTVNTGRAAAWLSTILLLSAYMFVSTEVLSIFHALNFFGIVLTWSFALVVTFVWWWKLHFPKGNWRLPWADMDTYERWMLAGIAMVLVMTGLVTVVAYPNNWDSMTYHLARIMHWVQQGNVEHYATNIDRQISQPPLAEYWAMHILLSSGRDSMCNLVQWTAMFSSLIAVYHLVMVQTGQRRAAWTAAFIAALIPMGILQASSTQNDYVTALFLILAVHYGMAIPVHSKKINNILLLSLSVSLGLLTKGSFYIFILPVAVWLFIIVIRHFHQIHFPALVAGLLVICMMNAPHFLRNQQTFGDFTGRDKSLQNEVYGLAPTLSNLSRNIMMEARSPFPVVNEWTTALTAGFHRLLGISENDPRTTWAYSTPFEVGFTTTHEDYAANPFHILLLIISLFWITKRRKQYPNFFVQACLILMMFLLFSILLKWQIWHNRLHLPLLLLAASLSGVVVNSFRARHQLSVLFILAISALPMLVFNLSRPLVGPDSILSRYSYHQYFLNREELTRPYLDAAAIVQRNGMDLVGLAVSGDAWEYPLWVILEDQLPEIRHVMVENPSSVYEEQTEGVPDGIFSNRKIANETGRFTYHKQRYYLVYENGDWQFFMRAVNPSTPLPE